MMPNQHQIEVPLLQALFSLGGKAHAQEVYKAVTKMFPQLTEADLAEPLSSGGNKWTNRIQWVRQTLIAKDEVASAGHGVWEITAKGAARLNAQSLPSAPTAPAHSPTSPTTASTTTATAPAFQSAGSAADVDTNLEDITDNYLTAFKQKVLNKLQDLSPAQFEQFAGSLLRGYGFQKIAVT